MLKSAYGFTLIELMVVIAITAIIGAFVLSNYRSFGEDQKLKNAVLNLQSQLRAAQTNATANVICGSMFGVTWQVVATTSTVYIACSDLGLIKGIKFGDNIIVYGVSGTGTVCPTNKQFIISFAPLSGRIDLGGTNCTSLNITLQNTKTQNTKSLIIEQGGRIYVL